MPVTRSPIGGRLYLSDDTRLARRRRSSKMIHSLKIEGYRCFGNLEMSGLGRINLLVGTNNSGKTSVLEALNLLTSAGDINALWQVSWRRGERLFPEERDPRAGQNTEIDFRHLFAGHDLHPGSKFSISAQNQTPERSVVFEIGEPTKDELNVMVAQTNIRPSLMLRIKGTPIPLVPFLPLSSKEGLSSDAFQFSARRRRVRNESAKTVFISTESLSADDLIPLWDKIALTPDESLVLRALQFLDQDIERIASQPSALSPYYNPAFRGGFKIKLKGIEQPVPIGSMGDGIWRMLAMAITITQCKGGVLLVDEIDTGLHYTVMSEMWKLIFGAAKEFDVQVFATSHSYDCVHSLAKICVNGQEDNNSVTLQRIEPGKTKAIPYSEKEIELAASRNIEVR